MKLNWLLVALLSLSAGAHASSSTDSAERPGVRVGVQAGMTYSNLSTPADVVPSNRSGLAFGLNLDLPLASFFSIQPEVLFVQRGANLAKVGNLNFVAKYNSLEFPLLAKLRLPGSISPFLVAGPVAILNVSHSVEATTPGGASSLGFSPKTFDFGLVFGGGIDVGPFFATLRYAAGITSLDESSADWKSHGFYLLAGIRI